MGENEEHGILFKIMGRCHKCLVIHLTASIAIWVFIAALIILN